VRYLFQAGKGQLELASHARPIPEVVRDERTPTRIRKLLEEVPAIKRFGEKNGLKATSNYTEYVKLDRPAAVWVVSACEPLRFKSREWNFPVVGSFPFLGWFDVENAKEFGEELKKEGLDVDVRGARAYSTVGWFRDPIVSTMIPEGDEALGELVNVVLHESVHATLYLKNQSYFNESLASFVAGKLTPVYLAGIRGPGSAELEAYVKAEADGEKRERLLHDAYVKLEALYASDEPADLKRETKASVLEGLKQKLELRRDINNATLIQYREYHVGMAEFAAVLDGCGGDFPRFFRALRLLRPESFAHGRQQEDLASVLLPLSREACPP
jgi:predicted aminopeptidase